MRLRPDAARVAAVLGGLAAIITLAVLPHAIDCITPPGTFEAAPPLVELDAGAKASPFGRSTPGPARGPLRMHPDNPRYFAEPGGPPVLLVGSHTWLSLQDRGPTRPVPAFDYDRYLDFLVAHGHNFVRLWVNEEANWISEYDGDYWTEPTIYRRTGPGLAADGLRRFDLTQFEPEFFLRLRQRVAAAGERGIYVSVMLFNGWSVDAKGVVRNNPWRGHPFNGRNNVNGIDGDLNGDGSGREVHTLGSAAVAEIQQAYVRKVVETVGDLDNVLYEISNESNVGSASWQARMTTTIREAERPLPQRHPIGFTNEFPETSLPVLLASDADWIAPGALAWHPPGYCGVLSRPRAQRILRAVFGKGDPVPDGRFNPPPADGSKVVVADTDHLWGIGGDRRWVWRAFTRGQNPIFMDIYDDAASLWLEPGTPSPDSAQWRALRANLGDARALAADLPLASMVPRGDLASAGFALADPQRGYFVVFVPGGGTVRVDLAATRGSVGVSWFDPARRVLLDAGREDGGALRTFVAPFPGDAVLLLRP